MNSVMRSEVFTAAWNAAVDAVLAELALAPLTQEEVRIAVSAVERCRE